MFAFSRRVTVRAFQAVSRPSATASSSKLWASTSTAAAKKYSAATLSRLEGLEAQEEFFKLSEKLQTSQDKLKDTLSSQLAATDPASEKAEYMHWLLSGYNDNDNGSVASPPPKKRAKQTKKRIRVLSTETDEEASLQKPAQSDSNTLFADRKDLHKNSKRAITDVLKLTSMTEIQAKTFQAASSGRDVLGRARTGTGKTIAFLLPAIERVLQMPEHSGISILVVSPTRELATQIANQAESLLAFHKHMSVQVMFGGTNKNTDINRLKGRLPSILVATPGRLLDHLQSTELNRRQSFGSILAETPLLVLDETDRLLDMGFRRDIERIITYLPKQSRQTLLFSATIPKDLKAVMAKTMKPDYIEVDCIHDGEEPTHAQVQQSHVIVPTDRMVASVVEVVRTAVEQDPQAKVVVFFPTARLVNFYAELFNQGSVLSENVLELHSKKSQTYRNRVSDEFRQANQGILFTSDVSARGVDYPNVSHVIQFGLPESSDQYIHRLGRTGRGANVKGQGWLILSEWEAAFLKELQAKDIAIPVDDELQQLIDNPIEDDAQALLEEVQRRVRGGDKVLAKSASGAYQAFLGYYLGQMKRMRMKRKEQLVDIANELALLTGLYEPPSLNPQMVGKMGLKGVAGLNIQAKVDTRNAAPGQRRNSKAGRSGPKQYQTDRSEPKQYQRRR